MPNHDFGFKIGDRVIVTKPQDDCPVGEVGIVTYLIDFKGGGNFEPWIGCRMESDGIQWHDILDLYPRISEGTVPGSTQTLAQKIMEDNGWLCRDNAYYQFPPTSLKKFTGTYKRKMHRCDVCGESRPSARLVRSKKGKYVCNACLEKKGYSTKNDTRVGKPTKAGWTFGFEFECIPKSKEDEAVLVSKKWGFIPTSDGSLPSGGVELKSPTINGRSSLKRMFDAANESVDFSNSCCGQHINIGNTAWMDKTTTDAIRSRATEIFYPLEKEMNLHEEQTTRLCGRFFGSYRERTTGMSSFTHGKWLNLDHNNRVEFRISKFVTPEQYFNLCNMWVDMLDMVHRNYIMCGCSEKAAKATGKELVKIFQRYAAGNNTQK